MSRREDQFCTFCGLELVKVVEPYYNDPSDSRVSLRCPKKRKGWLGELIDSFLPAKHSDVFIEIVDTVLNYDPITGERIKHVAK